MPFAVPFLAGVVVAPLVKGAVKPIARGVVKTSVGITLGAKDVSRKAREEVRSAAAEAASKHAAEATAVAAVESVPSAPKPRTRTTGAKS